MHLKHSIQKILFTFGLTAVLITGFNMHKDVVYADVLEETTEESTEKEDEYSHGNNENNRQTTTESEETHTESGFSYYWYNNKRPGQMIKDSNGNVKKYYRTRYEYLDLPKNANEKLPNNLSKEDLNKYTHYENSVFRKYQENEDVLYEDAFGNIVIQTYSTDRNSNSFYRTIGYTFSRVKNSGVLNLNSKKISKRKEVPANKKWLYDDNYNVDDATMKDWTKLPYRWLSSTMMPWKV